MGERVTGSHEVGGSIPPSSANPLILIRQLPVQLHNFRKRAGAVDNAVDKKVSKYTHRKMVSLLF